MKSSVPIVVITAVLAAAAGVAIAGLPSETPGADVVVVSLPEPELVTVTVPVEPVTPLATTTVPDTTVPPTTAPVASTSPSTSTPSVASAGPTLDEGASVSDPSGLADPADPSEIGRGELAVAVANGAGIAGLAGGIADALRGLGYDPVAINASSIPLSVVFYVPGFEAEASRLADDLGWGVGAIAPVDGAPELFTDQIFQLVAVAGTDQG